MKKDIDLRIEEILLKYRNKNIWNFIVGVVSSILIFITMYFLILPAMTLTENTTYTLHLKDNYHEYAWKTEGEYTTSYDLNLIFMDTNGNSIEGRDVTIEIGPDPGALIDDLYGFGYVPTSGDTTRGADLIEVLNLKEYVLSSGEKYVFDHAEVYIDGIWHAFSSTGNHWHIWCQSASSSTLPTSYGWRGNYDESTRYTITEQTEYKFVYRLVRYGQNHSVASLGENSGIAFQLFNYTGENTKTGINNNGIYDYFSFRGQVGSTNSNINATTDADGFGETRAKVLSKLENGYPVFNCGGFCTNSSLGYLFGASTNPNGVEPVGVTAYHPTNTLLQTEIIDGVEYYYYDSNRNAVDYDTGNEQFLLRDYLERGYKLTTYVNEEDRYEFLPFNNWTDNKNTFTNTSNKRTYQYEEAEVDYWFGMTMEFNFYMPRDGSINGKDMIFEFSGDDDVWVFIDDVLVLDLGGTHGAVDGSINFKTGKVEAYLNWNGTVGNKNKTTIYQSFTEASSLDIIKWNDTNTTFANYTKHTLKFFYLERGATVSNCKIKFNIPVLPNGSLSVGKSFEGTEQYDDTYEFTLYDVTTNRVVSNTEYTIGENIFTTDELGKFKLKNNEIAIFKLINDHTYYVEETDTGSHAVSYQCSFDGVDCSEINKTPEFTMTPESTYQAVFTNRPKTYQLEVSKIAYGSEENEVFEFKIQLRNKDGTFVNNTSLDVSLEQYEFDNEKGIITFRLKNEENIVIDGIPIDAVVILQEVLHDGYTTNMKTGDTLLTESDTYEFIMDDDKNITVYNIPGVTLPETGSNGIWFYFILGICFLFISCGYYYLWKVKEGG